VSSTDQLLMEPVRLRPVTTPPVLSRYARELQAHRDAFEHLHLLAPLVERSAQAMAQSLRAGGKLMLCGNGGSAADCQHIAAEFTGRFRGERAPLAAMALSTDTSALTCIGNDYGFEHVFARQVRALGRRGDCLIAISTSGRSPNVLRAVEAAHEAGMTTIALTGGTGGPLASACNWVVTVPCDQTARIQEAHIFIGHSWCALIEEALGVAGA
jgi:D-sedoheptulose 7-phosphate isomerase